MHTARLQRFLARPFLLEVFILFNLAFLILDVLVAHAVNTFGHWEEWIPVAFSGVATVVLVGVVFHPERCALGWRRWAGYAVGGGALLVGIAGLLLHLESAFFEEATLQNLVYSAPFVAPLAYAGLGFLLLLNRSVPVDTVDWGRWVVFLALGGFIGNFGLALADHAQNGFFYWTEWIGVGAAALAVGFLLMAVVRPTDHRLLDAGFVVMALQGVVGVLGFYFHVRANFPTAERGFVYSFVFGAPAFAPLLFADLALLAVLGLWDLRAKAARGLVHHEAAPGQL